MTEHTNDNDTHTHSLTGWWRSTRVRPVFWIVLVIVFAAGFLLRGGSDPSPSMDMASEAPAESAATVWTCSMHPQIRLPKPGKCPICFMDLIPVTASSDDDQSSRVLTMSENAKKLAQIVTAPVERRYAQASIQMVGKVDYDETKLAHISSWVSGRLDRLYVDYTGIEVKRGEHMVLIYSPELLAAQEELLQAIQAAKSTGGSGLSNFREAVTTTVDAARDKLRLWGLTEDQIKEIEDRGTPSDHVTIYAPIGGVVIEKSAFEGMYVKTGAHIYTIADLSHVWLKLEAYESDLKWLRYGQKVQFTTEALPGETFEGQIAFIDPVLDPQTRTVRVRVNVSNADRRLKPGMFVRATVLADIAASGKVADISLEGKWMCPMHPEVVSNKPGNCPKCGMALVTTESLGYVDVSKENTPPPLVIPASAPLITGKRAVVYVEQPDTDRPTYEGREVTLGPRAGDYYIVASGLAEGERVVVNGAFKIDSELQIRAKPSMMSPDSGAAPMHDHGAMAMESKPAKPGKTPPPTAVKRMVGVPTTFQTALGPVYDDYFALHSALAADDSTTAHKALGELLNTVKKVDASNLASGPRRSWDSLSAYIEEAGNAAAKTEQLEMQRTEFEKIAQAMIHLDYCFGHADPDTHYVTFCPMAFDNRGAYWLQNEKGIANPWFGHIMPKCGKVTDQIDPAERGSHD